MYPRQDKNTNIALKSKPEDVTITFLTEFKRKMIFAPLSLQMFVRAFFQEMNEWVVKKYYTAITFNFMKTSGLKNA